jgi:sigma-B regulation protein RsbU (phosphoserine phosphatase)
VIREFEVPSNSLDADTDDLYEHAPCGFVSTAVDGTIIKANATFFALTGFRADDLLGKRRLQDLLGPDDRVRYETNIAPMLQLEASVQLAAQLQRAEEAPVSVLLDCALKRDDAGRPEFIRVSVVDATIGRRYEEELLRARHTAEVAATRARLLARTLQESLIPPTPPNIPRLDVAAIYRPAGDGDEVGGDFYDVFETDHDDWVIVLGDVCGKGIEAAKVTALARYTLRTAALRARKPSAVLSTLNEALIHQRIDRFLTVVYARLRTHDDRCRMSIASGGHPLPLRARGDRIEALGTPGPLLGVLEQPSWHDTEIDLEPGDVVLFHSDGLPEARRDGEFFGELRLGELLRRSNRDSAGAIAAEIVNEVVDFQAGSPRDDIAVVVLRVPAHEV